MLVGWFIDQRLVSVIVWKLYWLTHTSFLDVHSSGDQCPHSWWLFFKWSPTMFTSKFVPAFSLLRRASCKYDQLSICMSFWHYNVILRCICCFSHKWPGTLQAHADILNGCLRPVLPAYCSSLNQKLRNYSTSADNTSPPRWVQLEPELEEALVPRKLSVSPLESWLSLRYSLPPLLESVQPQEDIVLVDEKVLPPISVPVMEDGEGSAVPISCKNVLEIRRRKMNRHKYKKLLKRTKFLRRRVLEGRGRKKQVSLYLWTLRGILLTGYACF